MTAPRQRRASRLGRTLRSLDAHTPLRVKLVAAMLVLVAAGLAAAGFAAVLFLRQYLLDQVDEQLSHSVAGVARAAREDALPPAGWAGRRGNPDGGPGQPAVEVPFYSRVFATDGASLSSGVLVARSGVSESTLSPPALPELDQSTIERRAGRPFTVSATDPDSDSWRVLVQPYRGDLVVVVALRLDQVDDTILDLAAAELVAGGLVLITLGGLGYLTIRSSLRPLMRVEATAEAIARGDLSRRVPAGDASTEVGRLALALNAMLAQIEAAFRAREASEAAARHSEAAARHSEALARESESRMRRFIADASHELRTPLTSIRGFSELLRRQLRIDPPAVEATTERIEAAATRMTALVEDLLLLARLDQQRPLHREPVDLLALAADAVADFRVTAPDHPVSLRVSSRPTPAEPPPTGASSPAAESSPTAESSPAAESSPVGESSPAAESSPDADTAPGGTVPAVVDGDQVRLRQILANLLANAGTHTPPGTEVTVCVTTDDNGVTLDVADTGPGLAPETVDRVFERFYRADTSRTRASGGTGLGLSIVAALVAAHRGTVRVASQLGEGTRFTVWLPLSGTRDDLPGPPSPAAQARFQG